MLDKEHHLQSRFNDVLGGVFPYITGFDTADMSNNERQRMQLEQQIHSNVAFDVRTNRSASPEDVVILAHQSIHCAFPNNQEIMLQIVVVGKLTTVEISQCGSNL